MEVGNLVSLEMNTSGLWGYMFSFSLSALWVFWETSEIHIEHVGQEIWWGNNNVRTDPNMLQRCLESQKNYTKVW